MWVAFVECYAMVHSRYCLFQQQHIDKIYITPFIAVLHPIRLAELFRVMFKSEQVSYNPFSWNTNENEKEENSIQIYGKYRWIWKRKFIFRWFLKHPTNVNRNLKNYRLMSKKQHSACITEKLHSDNLNSNQIVHFCFDLHIWALWNSKSHTLLKMCIDYL